MKGAERMEAAAIAGWLRGFAPTVWLLSVMVDTGGAALVSDEACAEYERKAERLSELLGVRL